MFPDFSVRDLIDILLVATILYGVFRLLRRSGAVNLFWGILAFLVAWWVVSFLLRLELTGALFDHIISVGAIAIIVIFQSEIRGFFYRIGFRMGRLSKVFRNSPAEITQEVLEEVVKACVRMSESKTGALIVLTRQQALGEYADSGEILTARVSARLIENIFFKNTPLHDGALIIHRGKLFSAACILPISSNHDLPKAYGLRHRSAMGITEQTDAVAIVVSEETGRISVAFGGVMHYVEREDLMENLRMIMGLKGQEMQDNHIFSAKNLQE